MDASTAKKCVDFVFDSPSPYIKIEFQGGEPLLNFDVIKKIVDYATHLNTSKKKTLEFVICTNLISITDKQLNFIKDNNISISTSLDGPEMIHDSCRKTANGRGTYRNVVEKMAWVKQEIGSDNVSALMTITPYSLNCLNKVVDEYLYQGLPSIFLRMINPYGRVDKNWKDLGYSLAEFLESYKETLAYIISLNTEGIFFPEEFAALLLSKIMTPFSTGFVDLQSPSGAGISGTIYETNGDVFVADEGRMLSRMTGDKTFCLGNVHRDSWQEMYCGTTLKKMIEDSMIESSPGCAWCAYQPYCGSDPVRNYIEYGDFKMHAPHSHFCVKHMAIFDHLFSYLINGDNSVKDVFWAWVTKRSVEEVRL